MSSAGPQPVTITVNDTQSVSGLLQGPPESRACYVLAHGAGAGMAHSFMVAGAGSGTVTVNDPTIGSATTRFYRLVTPAQP